MGPGTLVDIKVSRNYVQRAYPGPGGHVLHRLKLEHGIDMGAVDDHPLPVVTTDGVRMIPACKIERGFILRLDIAVLYSSGDISIDKSRIRNLTC